MAPLSRNSSPSVAKRLDNTFSRRRSMCWYVERATSMDSNARMNRHNGGPFGPVAARGGNFLQNFPEVQPKKRNRQTRPCLYPPAHGHPCLSSKRFTQLKLGLTRLMGWARTTAPLAPGAVAKRRQSTAGTGTFNNDTVASRRPQHTQTTAAVSPRTMVW